VAVVTEKSNIDYPLITMYNQWRAVYGSKGSIASIVKKQKEKNSYINNSI
jgi:hypothetical protein